MLSPLTLGVPGAKPFPEGKVDTSTGSVPKFFLKVDANGGCMANQCRSVTSVLLASLSTVTCNNLASVADDSTCCQLYMA
jgi:hypothetical protein